MKENPIFVRWDFMTRVNTARGYLKEQKRLGLNEEQINLRFSKWRRDLPLTIPGTSYGIIPFWKRTEIIPMLPEAMKFAKSIFNNL